MIATLDNRLRLPLCEIDDSNLEALKRAFTYSNPQYVKMKALAKHRKYVPKGIPEYIRSWKIEDAHFTVPRGAEPRVCELLGAFDVLDETTLGEPSLAGKIPDHRMQLRRYQIELQEVCVEREIALVRSPQGSGKTTVGYSLAARLKLPTLVVVPTEKIFDQWVKNAERQLGIPMSDVGIIKGSRRVVRPLTIGMQQTLKNCAEEYADVFGLVIGDEAQRFAADTFFNVIDKLKARYRIGMSADERRADKKEFLIYDVFGKVRADIDRSVLIRDGAIIDAVIRVVPTEFEAPWYNELKPQKRADPVVQRRLQNELNNDVRRNELVMDLLEQCSSEQKPIITLAWRREHCALLNSWSITRGWDSGLLIGGEDSVAEFRRTERELSEGLLRQAVGTYQAVGVGFDLPRVSRGIFAGPCAGNSGRQQFGQYCGRYERPDPSTGKIGANDAVIYYLWDWKVYGLNPIRNLAKWKPKVFVQDEQGKWIPARDYLKKARHVERDEDEAIEGFETVR